MGRGDGDGVELGDGRDGVGLEWSDSGVEWQ